jgi:hypothetical protein
MLVGGAAAADLPDLFKRSDYQDPRGASLRFIQDAPIVVVGSVTAVQEIGRARARRKTRASHSAYSYFVKCGDVIEETFRAAIRFHYYTFSNQNRIDLAVASNRELEIVASSSSRLSTAATDR